VRRSSSDAQDCVEDTITGTRDKALLLVGFSAALRRSELTPFPESRTDRKQNHRQL
jgi:hypothetical protein